MRFNYRLVSLAVALLLCVSSFASAESSQQMIDAMKKTIETLVDDYYYYKVECNVSGVIVKIAHEGLSFGVLSIGAGLSDSEVWEKARASSLEFANSLFAFIKVFHFTEPNCLFMLVDDLNMDTTYLSIYNGTIIYDYLPEK